MTTTSLFTPKPAAKPLEPRAKLVKRVSIALPPDARLSSDMENGLPLRRRQSARSSTQTANLRLERKLREDAARRASIVSRPKRPTQPRKTQDQLIADALELEERNVKSLKDFLAREEEKKRAARVVRKALHDGGVVAFISRAEEVRLPPVQVITPSAAPGEVTLPVLVSQDNVSSRPLKTEQNEEGREENVNLHMSEVASNPDNRVTLEAVDSENLLEAPAPLAKPPHTPKLAQDSEQVLRTDSSIIPLGASQGVEVEGANEAPAIASRPLVLEKHVERQVANIEQPGQPATAEALPAGETSQTMEDPSSVAPPQPQESTEEKVLRTRNLVALKDLVPADVIMDDEGEIDTQKSKNKVPWTWVEEMAALFGHHVDWGALRVVPARNRPIYRRPPICLMTGLPAPYRDPQTGIPYANAKAYRTLQRLTHHEFVWSEGRGVYWADETEHGARGVPASWNGYVRGIMPGQQAAAALAKEDVEMEDV
ncbi:hypothetical protein CALVIDRAFT_534080 [Calocera viscosa TUFC12733]|uniref:Vps72/YL1 C-terminal domain-containing protein n=1 Tax=Calocera viscosa (strain TUFC12733) TaxID=1330018 RepID=A0A167QDJ1_CALVF|nr:hypothetical protein CALVIDRAFT_534080 [Calocera viscosa TUFC12733]